MRRVYGIVNRKGGVGKTTTAVELAYNLAAADHAVLLIDCDSQGNATQILGPAKTAGLAHILQHGPDRYQDYIQDTDLEGVALLPATEGLGDWELSCTIGQTRPRFDRVRQLVEAIADTETFDGGHDAFDRIVIDFPPYYSAAAIACLSACTDIIIPAGVDAYSATGMEGLIRQIGNIRRSCPNVHISGILITQYHRADVAEDAVKIISESCPVPIYATKIRRTDKAVESTWARKPVGAWSPWCGAARDYRTWTGEILAKEAEQDG